MSLLPLRTMPVPPEVTQVEGCSCKGLDWHLKDCTIFTMPQEQAKEAIAAAHQRLRDHTDDLNRQLRAELDALQASRGQQ